MLKIYVLILLMTSSATHGKVHQDETKKICSVIGMCKGMLTGSYIKTSEEECLSFCNEVCVETPYGPCVPSCEWFSFNQNQKVCLHFNSCSEIDETFTEYVSGQKDCYQEPLLTKVLISGGIRNRNPNRNPTEVINLDGNEDVTCRDLEDFPIMLSNAVGGNLASSPVICGGQNQSDTKYIQDEIDTCFKLIKGNYDQLQWKTFATMTNKRAVAAGVVYQNTLHVFGGLSGEEPQYGGDILQSSEIITENGQLLQGEPLPVPLYYHAIASVNSTTSLLSGGCTIHQMDCGSPLTFFYNHVTQVFTSGPSLNVGRNYHASGTIIDKVTKEKFVVVNGGQSYNDDAGNYYIDSTEILVDQHWQEGPPMPIELHWHSMVEVKGDLFVIGGTYGEPEAKLIHKLSCSDGHCTWTTLTQKLKYDREGHVAILVNDSFCRPN